MNDSGVDIVVSGSSYTVFNLLLLILDGKKRCLGILVFILFSLFLFNIRDG